MIPIRTLKDLNSDEAKCKCQTTAAGVTVTFHVQAHGEQVPVIARMCELCQGVRAVSHADLDRAIQQFTLH